VETAGVLSSKGIDNVRKEGLIPTAEGLVQTWLGMSEAERSRLEEMPAEPIYVRPPHITAAAKKPWEI
jgi:tRNA threonylcarbamoyladenosine biosynthesis protein TsaB